MAFVGGDILEITVNHPTVGSFTLDPKGAEDGTFDPGGIRKNDDANSVTGSGQDITIMNRVRWSVETTVGWDMVTNEEMEKLAQIAASPVPAQFTFSHISGAIYKGTGSVVGDIQPNSNAATIGVKFAGGGTLSKL